MAVKLGPVILSAAEGSNTLPNPHHHAKYHGKARPRHPERSRRI